MKRGNHYGNVREGRGASLNAIEDDNVSAITEPTALSPFAYNPDIERPPDNDETTIGGMTDFMHKVLLRHEPTVVDRTEMSNGSNNSSSNNQPSSGNSKNCGSRCSGSSNRKTGHKKRNCCFILLALLGIAIGTVGVLIGVDVVQIKGVNKDENSDGSSSQNRPGGAVTGPPSRDIEPSTNDDGAIDDDGNDEGDGDDDETFSSIVPIILDTDAPTETPTTVPDETPFPTAAPIEATPEPTTEAPTFVPTVEPTFVPPTNAPSFFPFIAITTLEPTDAGTTFSPTDVVTTGGPSIAEPILAEDATAPVIATITPDASEETASPAPTT